MLRYQLEQGFTLLAQDRRRQLDAGAQLLKILRHDLCQLETGLVVDNPGARFIATARGGFAPVAHGTQDGQLARLQLPGTLDLAKVVGCRGRKGAGGGLTVLQDPVEAA